MKSRALTLALMIALCPVVAGAQGLVSPSSGTAATWSAEGGTVGVRLNPDLLGDLGIAIVNRHDVLPKGAPRLTDGLNVRQAYSVDLFGLEPASPIEFNADRGSFAGFHSGALQVRGGYLLDLGAGETIDLTDFQLRANATDPMMLDVVSRDGMAWFHVDKLMYELVAENRILAVYTSDLRASSELAARLQHPEMAGQAVGDVEILTRIAQQGTGGSKDGRGGIPTPSHWHGDAVAGQPPGTVYQADLFMLNFTISRMRQTGTSGHGGNGRVVFAPSSTLKNNVNAGTPAVTVPGQGALGTSTALWSAWIPWYRKFTGTFAPYQNDQHPYLIWNMYRVDPDGGIQQIARSGVKHAWLTTNGSCAPGENFSGQVLGRSCTDTYGTGNNDANQDLSLRSEIIPATNEWGRCGSIFDPNCVGSNTRPSPPDDGYTRRLVVNEAQLSNTVNPGATFLFDSWYLARQDINIYNSMASVTGTPTYSGGNWNFGGQSNYRLGSITDRWVENLPPGTQASNSEIAVAEGHTKVAARVVNLGNGTWRYHYAVHNLDFARARTSGSSPNLRVISNLGFDRFSVPVGNGTITDITTGDGDLAASNDWSGAAGNGTVSWAPTSRTNPLNWGTLILFSFTSNQAPETGTATLRVAQAGTPQTLQATAVLTPPAIRGAAFGSR
ncbi:MAG: hypothetical protein ABI650_03215 [Dokdonella sp.]